MQNTLFENLSKKHMFSKIVLFVVTTLVNFLMTKLWLVKGFIITGVDLAYPIFPKEELIDRLSSFSQQRNMGAYLGNNFAGAPQRLLQYLFIELFGGSAQFWEFFLLNLLLFLVTVYFLASVYDIYSSRISLSLTIVVAFAQTWALYLAFVWVRLQTMIYGLILITIVTSALIRYHNARKSFFSTPLGFSIVSLSLGWSLGTQPPVLILTLGFFLSLSIYLQLISRVSSTSSHRVKLLKLTFFYGIFASTNFWWLIPLMSYSSENNFFDSSTVIQNFEVLDLITFTSMPVSFFNSFRQIGDFAWFEGYWPQLEPWLTNGNYIIASMIIPFFIIIGAITCQRNGDSREGVLPFFALTFLVAMLFGLGNFGPLGSLYDWAVTNVPLFSLQRAPWQKFTVFLWLSTPLLLYRGLDYIMHLFNRFSYRPLRSSVISLTLIATLIVSPITLVAQGKMFSRSWDDLDGFHENEGFGFHLQIPEYVLEASEYINSKLDNSDVLLLPDSTTNAYSWGWGAPWDLTWQTLRSGIAMRSYGEGILPPKSQSRATEISNLFGLIASGSDNKVGCSLEQLSIGGVLLRLDFKESYVSGSVLSPLGNGSITENWQTILDSLGIWESKRSFGLWKFYLLDQDRFTYTGTLSAREGDNNPWASPACGGKLRPGPEAVTFSRNLQNSFRVLTFPSKPMQSFQINLREDNLDFWSAYTFDSISEDDPIRLQARAPLSNLTFVLSRVLSSLSLLKPFGESLDKYLGIKNVDLITRNEEDTWTIRGRQTDGVVMSFNKDLHFLVGVALTTISFLIILLVASYRLLLRKLKYRS